MTKHFSPPTTSLSLVQTLHLAAATTTKPGVGYLLQSASKETLHTNTRAPTLFHLWPSLPLDISLIWQLIPPPSPLMFDHDKNVICDR